MASKSAENSHHLAATGERSLFKGGLGTLSTNLDHNDTIYEINVSPIGGNPVIGHSALLGIMFA